MMSRRDLRRDSLEELTIRHHDMGNKINKKNTSDFKIYSNLLPAIHILGRIRVRRSDVELGSEKEDMHFPLYRLFLSLKSPSLSVSLSLSLSQAPTRVPV